MNSLLTRLFITLLLCAFHLTTSAQDCSPEECMWPGDANKNGICNNMDILWMGLALQDLIGGPSRDNPTTTWTPQTPPADWEGFFPVSNINHKYADTNGDGWVDGADMNLFPDLYGQTNDQFTTFLGDEIPGDDLFIIPSNPNPTFGESVELSIHLGTEENPINDIYGIAFTIEIDTSIIKEDFTTFADIGGWMKTSEFSLYTIAKIDPLAEILHPEFAFVLVFDQGVSGFGEIGKVNIVIEDIIIGQQGLPVDNVVLDFKLKRVLGLNAQEEDLLITIAESNLIVTDTKEAQKPTAHINIQHHPEAQRVDISSSSKITQATLMDMTGKIIYQQNPHSTELEIFTTRFPAGIYLIRILTEEGEITRKVFLMNSE